jgi:glycosyltransferase involved in cell wall biosynthesis
LTPLVMNRKFPGQQEAQMPKPFGLVMIEAVPCGTPVLGFRRGSLAEIIDDRLTGRIAATVDKTIRAAPEVIRLDRRLVRRRFEERFSSRRMANEYVEVHGRMGRGAKLVPVYTGAQYHPSS